MKVTLLSGNNYVQKRQLAKRGLKRKDIGYPVSLSLSMVDNLTVLAFFLKYVVSNP